VLKSRLSQSLGHSTFSGISIITTQLLDRFPSTRSALQQPGAHLALQSVVQALHRLTLATAMTVADAMAFRSESVSAHLQHMRVDVTSKASAGMPHAVYPEWVINLKARRADLPSRA